MARPLLIAVAVLLSAPCSSLGATVRGFNVVDGARVVFKAAPGETNHLRVSSFGDITTFTDTRRVRARGLCDQVDAHTVRCSLERMSALPLVRLGDRSDRVKVTGNGATMRGGSGDDLLRGSGALYGGAGDDTLRGGREDDQLNGGPGRDVVDGGGGADTMSDGETDTQAAVDRFDGGPQTRRNTGNPTGDALDYGRRRSDLTIDLAAGTWSTEDTVVGVESAGGGRGNDQLFGDAQDNALLGGTGADLIYGRSGHDTVFGGDGDDHVFGDDGNDHVSGDTGADAVSGGAGDDFLDGARESFFVSDRWYENPSADVLTCDAGADVARTDRLDTVTAECETMTMDIVDRLGAVPTIDADSADFALGCDSLAGCAGTISLSGPDGQPYGEKAFAIPEDAPADAVVAVPLNAVARTALQAGTLVQVDVIPKDPGWEPGGYRIFLRVGLLTPG